MYELAETSDHVVPEVTGVGMFTMLRPEGWTSMVTTATSSVLAAVVNDDDVKSPDPLLAPKSTARSLRRVWYESAITAP
jgi:hypothetical protein